MPEPTVKKYYFKSFEELQNSVDNDPNPMKNYSSTANIICNSIEKVYDEACKFEEENDLEGAYRLFSRCVGIFIYSRKNDPNYDETYFRAMVGKKFAEAVTRLQKLKEKLTKIYDELKRAEGKENFEKLIDTKNIDKIVPVDTPKSTSISNSINGVSAATKEEKISITCQELFEIAMKDNRKTLLVIDVRLKEDYLLSRIRIRLVDVINVSKDMLNLIPSKIETQLEDEFRELFKKRGDYGQVVLLDWFSTKSTFLLDTSSPIFLMVSKLNKFDPKTKYKSKPVILEGGYDEWLARYPNYTTNSNVSPPKRKIDDNKISIDHINYPTNALLEPEEMAAVENKPTTPIPPQDILNKPNINRSTKVISTVSSQDSPRKPVFDRSTKPISQEKKTEMVKENGTLPINEIKPTQEHKPIEQNPPKEDTVNENLTESFEEDEEELKNKCVRNGRRPALTTISNQHFSINDTNVDSDEDLDESYRNEEKENRMNAMKNARLSVHDETSSNLKRYSSTPNISKLENEYGKPSIDRSTKPSNDDQINIFTKTAMYTDEEGRGLTGLLNVGNTCYMNSILQCLSNTEHLRKLMRMLPFDYKNNKSKTEGSIAREVGNIIKQLWMKDSSPVSCRTLKNIVGKYRDTFRGSEQQDSHEFLTILIDWLHEDLNEPANDRCLKGADEKSGEKAWGEFISKNNSKIRQLFYGQQKSTVSCNTCEKESVTFEPFSNLSLPLPSAEKCTLAECLKLYTSNEHITGWLCPGCKSPRAATKKLDITKLPPLLVIHFKRFTSDGWCRKRLTNVDFPNLLDMTPYIIGHEHRNRRYELYAVSNHMGTMETGHYTANCRNSVNGRWYKFDDDNVSCIDNVTKSSSAYIVFYQCLLNN